MFGSGYSDDIHERRYKKRDEETHKQSAIALLERVRKVLKISTTQLLESTLFQQRKVIQEQLKILFEFQAYWVEQLIAIQKNTNHIPESNEDFVALPQGHLVKLNCGHRGRPVRGEEKRISRLLRKSGFLPMLEAR